MRRALSRGADPGGTHALAAPSTTSRLNARRFGWRQPILRPFTTRGNVVSRSARGTRRRLVGLAHKENRAATDLLLALATARNSGDRTTYDRLLSEATKEPARSLVLIDVFVRVLLNLAKERAEQNTVPRDELARIVALMMPRRA